MYSFFYLLLPILYISSKQHKKLKNNYVSFTHALSCSIVSGSSIYLHYPTHLQHILLQLSTTYFSWDTFIMILNKEYNNVPFIYHHIVCFYMLYKLKHNEETELITNVFFIGELSNLFNYIVYHMIQTKQPKHIITKMKILQLLWFSYFRVFYMSRMLYNHFSNIKDNILAFNLVSVYMMGLLWGFKQLKSIIA